MLWFSCRLGIYVLCTYIYEIQFKNRNIGFSLRTICPFGHGQLRMFILVSASPDRFIMRDRGGRGLNAAKSQWLSGKNAGLIYRGKGQCIGKDVACPLQVNCYRHIA